MINQNKILLQIEEIQKQGEKQKQQNEMFEQKQQNLKEKGQIYKILDIFYEIQQKQKQIISGMHSSHPAGSQLQQQLEILQKGFEQLVQRIPETIHLSCLSQNSKDVNRYTDCMMKRSKRVDKEMRQFDFKMIFMSNQFEKCIQSGDTDKCVESAKTDVQRYINEFQKNIN